MAAHKWVYQFSEGSAKMRDLLGGKGAGAAEMTRAGMPVPPGFTITTEACRAYLKGGGKFPEGLWNQVVLNLKTLERKAGKRFGDPKDPLLVSVRSGAKFSMPGMMDTVLNLGLNAGNREGPGRAHEERALRSRLPAPLHPDVRQDREGHRRRQVRARAAAGQEGSQGQDGPRADCALLEEADRPLPRHI